MTAHPVSVVIVSRGRPDALKRCLLGISQLQYDRFEVVVVADPEGIEAAQSMAFADHLKCVPFDEQNISAARNLGISHAAGDIVAFIDDDAVPEPSWLRYLCAPAAKADVAAMGGFVRGRNGISYQYKARRVGLDGSHEPLAVNPDQPTVLTPLAGSAIKTEGTNMAFWRSVLVELGGFDPSFRFFLDETDLNVRLAKAGFKSAITPLAEVHHGFAASAFRRQDRVPRDLFEIGASWAVYQRKHLPADRHTAHWETLQQQERRRLLQHMVAGRLEPRDVRRMMKRLKQGHAAGLMRVSQEAPVTPQPLSAFRAFPSRHRDSIVLSARLHRAKAARLEAEAAVREGTIATLMIFSPTALYHHVRFADGGIWEQRGGLFGRANRGEKMFRLFRFRQRLAEESRRVAKQRLLNVELH